MVQYMQIGKLCDIKKGKKVNILNKPSENAVPYLLIDTLRGHPPEFFTADSNYTEANESDLLMVFDGANSGLVGTGLIGAVGSTIGRIRTSEELNNKYLTYFLVLNFSLLNKDTKGSAIPHVKPKNLLEMKIRLPILEEQIQIVDEIEKQFTRLDAAIKRFKDINRKLEFYKNSILKNAFEGELTKCWRINNPVEEDASELLKKCFTMRREEWQKDQYEKMKSKIKLQKNINWNGKYKSPTKIECPANLPKGWAYGLLEDLIYIAGRIGWRGLKAEEYTNSGPLFLSVYNLNTKGKQVSFDNSYHISNERYEESPEIKLRENDILLTKDGAGIGKIGIVKGLEEKATVNSSLLLIRAGGAFAPEFLLYFLIGPNMQRIVKQRITGSAIPHLFQRDIKKFKILIPPKIEQMEIIKEIESRFSVIDKLEETVERDLKKAELLRKSILKSAFEGKLVSVAGE